MSYQSDYSGAQVDEAVGKALNPDATPTQNSTNLVTSGGVFGVVSNRNLLDNPWFRVNQRGATSGTQIAYIADRWTVSYGIGGVTWSRTDDTITVQSTSGTSNAYVSQKMEPDLFDALDGKTVTVSVMLNDYSIIHNTVTWSSSSQVSALIGKGLDNKDVRIETTVATKTMSIRKTNTAETFRAFKLELGSVSTLANDVVPNYADELEICKYYYSAPTDVTATNVKLVNAPIIKIKDGVCYIYIQANSPSETLGTNWVKLFTVPSSVRPPVQVGCNLTIYPYRTPLFARLTIGGDFEVYNDQASIATNTQLNAFLAYPLLDERS